MCKSFHIAFVLCSILLTGCTSPRQMTLFRGTNTSVSLVNIPQYTIAEGDILQIVFSAVNSEAVSPYNSAGTEYVVEQDGTISMPVLGRVSLAGKTTSEVITYLTEKVSSEVRQPLIKLKITNATITILGEVKSPSQINVPEPITLIEAIGKVGGLTRNAKCKDVVVQRRQGEQLKTYHINLLTNEVFTSPCYYLNKGDVVYIAPLHAL